jgi:hypothetical protein
MPNESVAGCIRRHGRDPVDASVRYTVVRWACESDARLERRTRRLAGLCNFVEGAGTPVPPFSWSLPSNPGKGQMGDTFVSPGQVPTPHGLRSS